VTIFQTGFRRAIRPAIILGLMAVASVNPAAARAAQAQDAIEAGDSLAGNFLAAVVAGAARDTEAAAIFYKEALKADPKSPELLERAFVALLAEGNVPEAAKLAEKMIAKDPNNGLAQLTLGVRDIKAKQWAKARSRFAKGGRGHAADLTATLLTAWTWLGSGDPKKALETVDRLKGEEAFALFRDYHAGLIADLGGNTAEATKRLKSAYDAESRTLRIVDVYGRFQARRGDRDAALKTYDAFDKLLPRHPMVMAAEAAIKDGKPVDPAVKDATAGAAEVLYGLGAAGNRQGDELAAMIYLRLSLWLEPDNPLAVITLADLYDRLKQPDRANDVYALIGTDSPMHRNAEIQIAINLEQMERSAEALDTLKKLVAERPKDIEAITALGKVQSSRKEFGQAADTYSQAIALIDSPDPGNWTLYYFRGIAYERTKNWPKAEADFKKALELAPEQPLVLNYLGYSWVDQNMNLQEAFKMLERAVQQRPNDGYIVDSLGWAHYRLGHYDEAVRYLERAIELKPSDPVINDHLGDAYWKTGRKLEATFQWNHARDLKPEPEDLARILKKIETGIPEDEKPAAAEADAKRNGG
jgi:Flp pilus assembly protein TadD